jgi:2'-5' RNA ligase
MRIFVALPLPDTFKQSLLDKTAALRAAHPEFRWTPEENLHITLAFLGELDDAVFHLLAETVENAASATSPLSLRSSALMTFPQRGPAAALALGFDRGQEDLAGLADRIETGLERIRDEGRYPFRPRERRSFAGHLTIARKGRRPLALAGEERSPIQIAAEVGKVVIFQSELRREGAAYTPLAEFLLRNPRGA